MGTPWLLSESLLQVDCPSRSSVFKNEEKSNLRFQNMKVREIMKDEDILLPFKELSVESDSEFKKEQDDRSLSDQETPEIEEEIQEDLHEDASSSSSQYDIKEDEDILLRLQESIMESIRESVHAADLAGHQSLAEKECDGGFKHKIEKENQEALHEDTSHSPFDVEKDDDFILRLNRLFMESVHQLLADRKTDGGFKHKTEDTPHSRYIKKYGDIILRLNKFFMESVSEFKTKQDRRSLAGKENHGKLMHKIEEASPCRCDMKKGEEIILRLNELFMELVRESVKAADESKKEQNDLKGDSNVQQSDGKLKQKIEEDEAAINKDLEGSNSSDDIRITMSSEVGTESVNPFDIALGHLEELEEIVLKFYEFMDQTFSVLKKVRRVKYREQEKLDFLENVQLVLLTSYENVDMVIEELELMKEDDENQEKSSSPKNTKIPGDELFQEVEINANSVKRSFHHTIASLYDDNCREMGLSSCVEELHRAMQNMKEVILRIRPRKWILSTSEGWKKTKCMI